MKGTIPSAKSHFLRHFVQILYRMAMTMELHKKSNTRLFAQLSRRDLSEYRLSFETLCPDSEQTKLVLRDILDCARQTLGWAVPPQSRVSVDVLPAEDGSCIFLFTAKESAKKRFRVKKDGCARLCVMQSADDFLALYPILSRTPLADAVYDLFEDAGRYFALLRFPTPFAAEQGAAALSEFGSVMPAGEETCRYLSEHTTVLLQPKL